MESKLDPAVVYENTDLGITEHDIDVVSEMWEMDGREVYRGVRDPQYTHADVYWLYSENLERVGLVEHSKLDHAVFHVLWYHDSDFATFLQEEGWISDTDLWTRFPRSVFDRFVNEGWGTIDAVLEQCLHGPTRLFTVDMIRNRPLVYTCSKCGRKSLKNEPPHDTTSAPLDLPEKEKVLFVDDDLVLHVPPPTSTIWYRLGFMPEQARGGGSLHPRPQEPEPEPSV